MDTADDRLLKMVYAVMKEYEALHFDWTVNEDQEVYQRSKTRKTGKRVMDESSEFVVSEEDLQIADERAMDIIEGRAKGIPLEIAVKKS